jgi:hypothetical protein
MEVSLPPTPHPPCPNMAIRRCSQMSAQTLKSQFEQDLGVPAPPGLSLYVVEKIDVGFCIRVEADDLRVNLEVVLDGRALTTDSYFFVQGVNLLLEGSGPSGVSQNEPSAVAALQIMEFCEELITCPQTRDAIVL